MNILRRLPLSRLLLLCGLVLVIGVSATALASALGSSPVPPAKPLATAIHDALSAPAVEGISARVTLTDHLIEGANLAGGSSQAGEIASSPLLSGGSGRLWISREGRFRLELQAEKGDTQVVYDGHTLSLYDAANNTLYRYVPDHESSGSAGEGDSHAGGEPPSVQKIEEAIARIRKHANLSDAIPTDVAGHPAYTVRISPDEAGSLIAGAELSFDADHGTPLRAAVYSTASSAPVIELAATELTYGAVESSVFDFTAPSSAKVEELKLSNGSPGSSSTSGSGSRETSETTYGHGIASIAVVKSKASSGSSTSGSGLEGLPKVSINGTSASELKTELGTILAFERAGVRYVVAGAVQPSAVEAVARGL